MANIPYIKEEISKLKKKEKDLNNKLNEVYMKIHKLQKQWKKECSHPREYIKIINAHYEDDYGKLCTTPDNELISKCVICEETFKNE